MKLRPLPDASFARSSALISTAPARVVSTCDRYFGLARNASWSGPAWSSGARLPTRCEPLPTTVPPNRWTMSSSVNAMPVLSPAFQFNLSVRARTAGCRYEPRSVRSIARGRQRLEYLIGDIDTRAHIHRFLHDQVVVLRLGDLLDDLVGAV